MAEVVLAAQPRTTFGKGASRQLRRDNQVPAVLYGHGTDPVHLALPGHATMLALKTSNALLSIDLGDRTELAIPKDVQRDPIKGFIEHVDLLLVRRGERVEVEVRLNIVGTPVAGNLVTSELTTLTVEVEATHIPTGIDVSIDGLDGGDSVLAKDIALPAGAVLVTDPETLIVHITAQATNAEPTADDAAATEE
jgi:large subunit ribosomal protein L25